MKEIKAQVFFLTETKIDVPYSTAQFKISCYDMHLPQWPYQGWGGIMAFISSGTPSTKLPFHRKFSTIEPLIVEAKFGKIDVVVVGIYRPQNLSVSNNTSG